MRQLGTLSDTQSARRLSDYLQSLAIETRLDQDGEAWVIWILDEDKLPRAREELQLFLSNPTDALYRQASEVVRTAPRPETASRRRPQPDAYAGPYITIALFVLSVLVTLLFWSPETKSNIAHEMFIERLKVKEDGLYRYVFNRLNEIRLDHEYWRLITPIFIHLHVLHLLFNMLALWELGRPLERHMGSLRFVLFVLFVGVLSNLAQYYWSKVRIADWALVVESSPAFGGISGVGYALFGYLWMRVVYDPSCGLPLTRGTVIVAMCWFFLCMTGGVGPIGNTAHLVGLALGMIVAYMSAWWTGFGQNAR